MAHMELKPRVPFTAEGWGPQTWGVNRCPGTLGQGSRVLGLPSPPPASPLRGGLLGSFRKSQSRSFSCRAWPM